MEKHIKHVPSVVIDSQVGVGISWFNLKSWFLFDDNCVICILVIHGSIHVARINRIWEFVCVFRVCLMTMLFVMDEQRGSFEDVEFENNDSLSRSDKQSFNSETILAASSRNGGTPSRPRKGLFRSVLHSIRILIFSNKISVLIPLGPVAIVIAKVANNHGWVFVLSMLGIVPMAERLGFTTEQLAIFTGPTMGGLLNATFGNATELIISLHALKNGFTRVVQQSLLGSILSNMLLVLGCAFLSGGLKISKREQVFDRRNATVNSSLLLMSVMCLLFPAVLHSTRTELHYGKSELALSRFSSCVMLVAYAAYLFFQLKSQKKLYTTSLDVASGEPEEEEIPEISKWEAIIWLALFTIWIAVLSEYLVDAIQGASTEWKIPIAFISVILLPIVGNAAEHIGAIMFAMKDKLDISLGVAIGSSTQIAMFGVPFLVVVGWIMKRPMDLNFQIFETATLFMTVLVVAFMLQEGTSNYFKGLMLILCYLIIAASFFVHTDSAA